MQALGRPSIARSFDISREARNLVFVSKILYTDSENI